jgi:gluconolactonase
MKKIWICAFVTLALISCKEKQEMEMPKEEMQKTFERTGTVEVLDESLKTLISETDMEVLAGGFNWSEGPLWIREMNALIFSDVPENTIYKWTESDSVTVYLRPSGYTGEKPRGGEMGSNGLTLSGDRKLTIAQHGNRVVGQMNAPLASPTADYTSLASSYNGKKFNSPNDVIFSKDSTLFFTDPPYGLEGFLDDSTKELSFSGVYMKRKDGEVVLIDDQLTFPNGIALSRDESKLYVACSDPEMAIWKVYDLDENLKVKSSKIFFDATEKVKTSKGLPDGLKVHSSGNIFATGPGGVYVFDAEGKHLGTINTGQATSNCAFDDDENYLYMTADDYLMRIKMNK